MTHKEIVMKIIGPIRPVGESNSDDARFDNLKVMCDLVDDLVSEIAQVANMHNRFEFSIKRAAGHANKYLRETLILKS